MTTTGEARSVAGVVDYLSGADWEVFRETAGPGSVVDPGTIVATAVSLPTTVAAVVRDIDGEQAARDRNYDDDTWWFRTTVEVPADVDLVLHCAGLATICEVWANGTMIAESESMFVPLRATLRCATGRISLALRFRSLTAYLARRRPRGRWRSSMIAAQGLRWVRTTMLGRAPVYNGVPPPVGPWRPITLTPAPTRTPPRLRGGWRDGTATLRIGLRTGAGVEITVEVAGLTVTVRADADGRVDSTVAVPGVRPWWPHSHGAPARYSVRVTDAAGSTDYLVGFRDVTVDRSTGGFTLAVNGIPIFCRGACWVPVDPIGFGSTGVRDLLEQVAAAGGNMVRVVGTMVYENPEFYDICSELGLLVWQDLMIGTIDPPTDEDFTGLLRAELDAFLGDNGHQAALAVISGGSETDQQPTMLGLSADEYRMPFSDSELPVILAREGMSVGCVPSSPSGGDLATHEGSGIAHYFGVGGYLRPLDDVRAAGVRFAAECLAFAIPPERRSVEALFGSANPAGHDPVWKRGVPRDRGASWDFEDVRDHYVRTLFGVEPSLVRRDDPEYYLDLGRAAICEAVTTAYSYWRGSDSGCDGALVLSLRDTAPGAGWGLVDALGVPKAPWYPWTRAAAPVAILLDDRGLDGLRITVPNDRSTPLAGRLMVALYTAAGLIPVEGAVDIEVPAHGRWTGGVDGVLGRFTDATHAHRFGRRGYEAIVVRVLDPICDVEVARAVHLVAGPRLPLQHSIGLSARCTPDGDGWNLRIATTDIAQYVVIDCAGAQPADNWFHLAPGTHRDVPLRSTAAGRKPSGRVRALNAAASATIEVADPPE